MSAPAVSVRALALLVLALAALVTGCGGSGNDFSGRVIVPTGFQEIKGPGGSFVSPSGWAISRVAGGQEVLTAMAPVSTGSQTPSVSLTHTPPLNGNFDGTLALRRALAEKVGANRTKTRKQDLDINGAQRSVRFRTQASFGDARYDLDDLAVMLKDGSALFLSVSVPVGGDADTIVKSFRVTGG